MITAPAKHSLASLCAEQCRRARRRGLHVRGTDDWCAVVPGGLIYSVVRGAGGTTFLPALAAGMPSHPQPSCLQSLPPHCARITPPTFNFNLQPSVRLFSCKASWCRKTVASSQPGRYLSRCGSHQEAIRQKNERTVGSTCNLQPATCNL